jgi:hypothetical protein
MTASEVDKIFKKPGEKRYDYFIKKVAETEEVFGLYDDEGWALLGDESDADILPFFAHAELAEAFRVAAGFEEYRVEQLDANELLEWLDDMVEEGMMVAVMPNPQFNGAVVEPTLLKTDLQTELEKYDEDGKRIVLK